MHIIEHDWVWARPLVDRTGKPPGVVEHHTATTSATPEGIHRYDIEHNQWSGFGYHLYVRKDGSVHRGRPLGKMGAHALGYNDWIGVCAEGNFMNETMNAKQLAALKEVSAFLRVKYPGITFKRHRDMPGNATACPGTNYPFVKVTAQPSPVIVVPVKPRLPRWFRAWRRWLRLRKRH